MTFAEVGASAGVSEKQARSLLDGLVTPRKKGWRKGQKRDGFSFLPPRALQGERSWERSVVDRLCEIRRCEPSWTFADAWRQATKDYPTPARYQAASDTLFAEDGEAEESHAEFFERACSDAWHGMRPALAHFSPALLLSADEGFTSTDVILA